MVSRMDDYPVHQIAEPVAHIGTSDRNFYDRYYFNMHNSSDELFVIFGMGQYPNLGTQDAFCVVRRGDEHRAVQASREMGDRMDTSVGPFRIEVIEGLKKVRYTIDDNEHGIAMDVTWDASVPAVLEGRHFRRQNGRVSIDTSRFAQTGYWSGVLRVDGTEYQVTPDRWKGCRDRSWGVRPVGEPEPPGIRASQPAGQMARGWLWNYLPMQFDDFSIVTIIEEDGLGIRSLQDSTRVWADPERPVDKLTDVQHHHEFRSGTRVIERSKLTARTYDGEPIEVSITPLVPVYLMVGSGYGGGEWGHGTYHGKLAINGGVWKISEEPDRFTGFCDALARYELGGQTGYGLLEYACYGPNKRYGFESFADGAR